MDADIDDDDDDDDDGSDGISEVDGGKTWVGRKKGNSQ